MRCNVRIGELLDQVRQYYVDRFIKTRDELLAEQNTRLILEPELRGNDGIVVTEGVLQLPLRTDMAVIKDGAAETLSIDTERMLSFDPVSFIWGAGLEVRVGPFQWQAVRLQVVLPETTRWQPLQHWFWRWFKENAGEHNEAAAGRVPTLRYCRIDIFGQQQHGRVNIEPLAAGSVSRILTNAFHTTA
jgi:hypothetical protein